MEPYVCSPGTSHPHFLSELMHRAGRALMAKLPSNAATPVRPCTLSGIITVSAASERGIRAGRNSMWRLIEGHHVQTCGRFYRGAQEESSLQSQPPNHVSMHHWEGVVGGGSGGGGGQTEGGMGGMDL